MQFQVENLARFGLIIPSSNTSMESEFWRMTSGWATIHAERLRFQKITVDELEAMEAQLSEGASRLADAEVNVIGYGCTSGSLFKGKDHDREIEDKITAETGIPAVATARAVIEAMESLNISRVCVATPYTDEISELEKSFLEQNKIEVLKIVGLGIEENLEVGRKAPDVAYELAKKAFVPEAPGIFISCTNFRTIEIIDSLEKELDIPVVSSNTATLWAMMKKAGIKRELESCGRLLS